MMDLNGVSAKRGVELLGIIGDPVAYSLSPLLFSSLLKELGLNDRFQYRAWRVRAGELGAFLAKVRESATLGLNVTIPHKERIMPFLDDLDATADLLGATNTIVNESGRLVGYNTDWIGFLRSLQARAIRLAGQEAVMLGAGGAAKAVSYALVRNGVQRVTIYNRTSSRAVKLAQEMCRKTGFRQIYVVSAHSAPSLASALRSASLLINATSVGMYPAVDESPLADPSGLHPGLIVYDLIYNPLKTALVKQAEARGAQALGGLDMLIYQALESLKIWIEEARQPPSIGNVEALIPTLRQQLAQQLQRYYRG